MSFLLGMDINCFKARHCLKTVGEVIVKDLDKEYSIAVSCFVDTGTLFMNGRFAPAHLTIGQTLNWYIGETIMEIDIEDLFFDNSALSQSRCAHAWEKRTFLLGHWKQYAKNNIQIKAVIRLRDEENESVYLTIAQLQQTRTNEQPPPPLDIQPFS